MPVPPLALPDPAHLPDLETLGQIPAVALFLERAREVDAGFALTPENAQAIAEICQRLDGLPLALELAAARINVLPPKLLLARLGHRLPLLTHGARDLPERQQTLRNTIAWSYDLLSPEEQRLFRSLAVFTGGFSTDDATALERARPADAQAEPEQPREEMLDRLEALVSKNLLRAEPGRGIAPRFFLLATIEEYAQEQLEAHGEQSAVQERCVHVFLTLAQTAELQLYLPERDAWMERLESEDANLRAALPWCKQNSHAIQIGLRLAGALTFFWFLSGNIPEGRSWLETMLARTAASDRSNARGRALFGAGLLAWEQGDAKMLYQGVLRLWQDMQRVENGLGIIWGLVGLAEIAAIQGQGARSG